MERELPRKILRKIQGVNDYDSHFYLQTIVTCPRALPRLPRAHQTGPLSRSADWQFKSWRAITDQIRGGVSTAQLVPSDAGAKLLGKREITNSMTPCCKNWAACCFLETTSKNMLMLVNLPKAYDSAYYKHTLLYIYINLFCDTLTYLFQHFLPSYSIVFIVIVKWRGPLMLESLAMVSPSER